MIKILHTLILVRLRKFFGKVDFLTYALALVFCAFGSYILLKYTEKYSYYFLLFSLEILRYHIQRTDLELLKLCKKYKKILYLEYSFYSLVYTVPLLILQKWLPFIIFHLLIILFINIKKQSKQSVILKYPFRLLDPFWIISFRKYRLILVFIPVMFFIYVGNKYGNHNLILFTYLLVSVVLSIPSFQREDIYFIRVSRHQDYLKSQLKTGFYNSLFLIVPLFSITLILGKFELLWLTPLIPIPMFLNILLKYTFFKQMIQQQFLYILILSGIQYFLPFIALPLFIYYGNKRLKSLNK